MKKESIFIVLRIIIFSLITVIVGILSVQSSLNKLRENQQELFSISQKELEKILVDEIPYKRQLRNLYSLGLRAQDKAEARDFYITKTEDGYLQQANYFAEINPNIATYAKRLAKMNQALKEQTSLLYVGTSGKYIRGVSQIRSGYPTNDMVLRNLDELFLELSYRQINTLDLRRSVPEERNKYQQNYYRTHSIWTDVAAFHATIQIMNELQTKKIIVDYAKPYALEKNYQKEVYPQKMLGDQLHSTGKYFTDSDDLILLTPKLPVDLTYTDLSTNQTRRGEYYQSVINPVEYARKDTSYFNASKIYFGTDPKHFKIVNNQIGNGGKILLLTDSYFLNISPYLALMNQEVEVVVTESASESKIEKLVEDGNFDVVLVASQSVSIQDSFFNFYK